MPVQLKKEYANCVQDGSIEEKVYYLVTYEVNYQVSLVIDLAFR